MTANDVYSYASGKTKIEIKLSLGPSSSNRSLEIFLWPEYPNTSCISLLLEINDYKNSVQYRSLFPTDNRLNSHGYGRLIVNTSVLFLRQYFESRNIDPANVRCFGECAHGIREGKESNSKREKFWIDSGFDLDDSSVTNGSIPMECQLDTMNVISGKTKCGQSKIIHLDQFRLNSFSYQLSNDELVAIKSFPYQAEDLTNLQSLQQKSRTQGKSARIKTRLLKRVVYMTLFIMVTALTMTVESENRFELLTLMGFLWMVGFSIKEHFHLHISAWLPWEKSADGLLSAYGKKSREIKQHIEKLEERYDGLLWRLVEATGSVEESEVVATSKQFFQVYDNNIDQYVELFQEYKQKI